jgi:signal transduction histidine kinase
VLSNLLGNAVKFTPDGGKVTIHAEARGQGVAVSVADTGPGIPPEQAAHIFDRFWQAEHRGRDGGTGLGLAIAKGIVDRHGGTIEVASEVGRGSVFAFTIPADR